MAQRTRARASRRFTRRSTPASACSTPETTMPPATTSCSSAERSVDRRDKAVLSVKFGALRGPDGSWIGMDTRPVAVKNFLAYSLRRLGVDHIDIYCVPVVVDPGVPIEETVGAIADLVKAGYVRAIRAIRSWRGDHPSRTRGSSYFRPSDRVLAHQPRPGGANPPAPAPSSAIGVTAYGVLSRGLLSGSKPKSSRDFRTVSATLYRREPPAEPTSC